jgi:hypothetical protein
MPVHVCVHEKQCNGGGSVKGSVQGGQCGHASACVRSQETMQRWWVSERFGARWPVAMPVHVCIHEKQCNGGGSVKGSVQGGQCGHASACVRSRETMQRWWVSERFGARWSVWPCQCMCAFTRNNATVVGQRKVRCKVASGHACKRAFTRNNAAVVVQRKVRWKVASGHASACSLVKINDSCELCTRQTLMSTCELTCEQPSCSRPPSHHRARVQHAKCDICSGFSGP